MPAQRVDLISITNMHSSKIIMLFVVSCLGLNAGSQAFAHEEEILVGRTATGEIHLHMDFDQPVVLPLSIFPGINGYAFGELAFHSTSLDEPAEDFFQLSTATNLRFILLAKDPGMEVWNDTGSGFMATNEMFQIGVAPFDTHPIWNLVNGTPGNSYSLTLKVIDLNGVYSDSDPFVLNFTPIQTQPRIDFQKTGAQSAVLSWPTNAVGWELQSADSGAATSWDDVTNNIGIVGANYSVSITTTNTQQFYRLYKP
jgi:hypothetical protein